MLLENNTPLAAMGFGQLHRDGNPMAAICVRGTFDLMADGSLVLTEKQAIVPSDVYEGDPHRTSLVRVGDLIPYKPAADITLIGTAYAPGGRPAESWEVGVTVGIHEVRLRVHGPRQWEPAFKRLKPAWKLGSSEPAVSVPLDYRYAAGGRFIGDPDGNGDARNLIGPGVLHKDWTRYGRLWRAPQIDNVQHSINDPFGMPAPQGFGPIPPFWSSRQKHAGTYDEVWQSAPERRLPDDFDYRFYQTAHADLIVPHLIGADAVRLSGLVPNGGTLAFELPDYGPVAHHTWSDGRKVTARLALDGLHLDLRRPQAPWRADLTWRGWLGVCPAYRGATLALENVQNAFELPTSSEFGLVELEAEL